METVDIYTGSPILARATANFLGMEVDPLEAGVYSIMRVPLGEVPCFVRENPLKFTVRDSRTGNHIFGAQPSWRDGHIWRGGEIVC